MAKTANDILSVDNPVFSTYIFYTAILIIKMMIMSLFTAFYRIWTKVFLNQTCRNKFTIMT